MAGNIKNMNIIHAEAALKSWLRHFLFQDLEKGARSHDHKAGEACGGPYFQKAYPKFSRGLRPCRANY